MCTADKTLQMEEVSLSAGLGVQPSVGVHDLPIVNTRPGIYILEHHIYKKKFMMQAI